MIPALQDQLVVDLGKQNIPEDVVRAALKRWHAMEDPINPLQHGCFAVFQKVQDDILSETEP